MPYFTALNLDPSSKAVLTKDTRVADPSNPPNGTMIVSSPCDMKGNIVTDASQKIYIWRNLIDGDFYARLAEKVPMSTTSAGREAAAAITAQNPVHYASVDGSIVGYFVPAPDFNNRDKTPVAAAPGTPNLAPILPQA